MTNCVPNVDDTFYHLSDAEEGEDAILDIAFDQWEQLDGGPSNGPQLWAQFNDQLCQLRDPVDGDNIGLALNEALHNATEAELQWQQRPAHHFVNFALTTHGFMHAHQTADFTVGEFLQWTAQLDEMLAKLAGKLNSNESFNPECGFQVDVVFASMPGLGSGRAKKYNPGRRCLDRENKKKRCIITIKNRDAL